MQHRLSADGSWRPLVIHSSIGCVRSDFGLACKKDPLGVISVQGTSHFDEAVITKGAGGGIRSFRVFIHVDWQNAEL